MISLPKTTVSVPLMAPLPSVVTQRQDVFALWLTVLAGG